MRKTFLIIFLTVFGFSLILPTKTSAFWPFDIFNKKSQKNTSLFSPLIEKIIEKFNLNKDEVEKVANEFLTEKQKERQALTEQKLNQAVKDGVITESQEQALLKRQTEMQTKRTQTREEMQKWVKESGVDFETLAPYGVGFGRGKFGRGFGRGRFFGGF